jgi:hypothetical protein
MSSIFELFGDPALEGEDAGAAFDPSNLDKVLDDVIANRPVAGRPQGFDPAATPGSQAPSSDGEVPGAEGGGTQAPAPVPPETPASAPPPPAAETPPPPAAVDPLADLGELERLELAQLRQALADPDRALAVRRAMLGVPEAATPPAAVDPTPLPPAPTLPEEIDPGSFEAQLWQQNQTMLAEIQALKAGQQATTEQTEQERMNAAAQRTTQAFTSRYGARLSAEEIAAVCQHAGLQKLPEAFYPTTIDPRTGQGDWDKAMTQALEFVVRSNDGLLAKVLGAGPGAPAPVPGADTLPNKRVLTALSSAASPSGEAATRVPLEHRGDGKLTEKSRIALVQELMNGHLTGSPGEGI